jgi:hypothetical protein
LVVGADMHLALQPECFILCDERLIGHALMTHNLT